MMEVGRAGAPNYYVLMQRTCLPSCTESIVKCLWIYGDLMCTPIMNTRSDHVWNFAWSHGAYVRKPEGELTCRMAVSAQQIH